MDLKFLLSLSELLFKLVYNFKYLHVYLALAKLESGLNGHIFRVKRLFRRCILQ